MLGVIRCIMVHMEQTMSRMERARLRKGWTLRQLADRCAAAGQSADHSNLSRIERGDVAPRPALRAVLAQVLDMAIDDLPH